MRKTLGVIKKKLAVLLIVALSINSFGAIVSDNDGSAFITKSEFDSIKASFQSVIDQYNQSIDSKIDGTIASYLAGIRLGSTKYEKTLVDYSSGVRSIVADAWTLGVESSYKPGGLPWVCGYVGCNFNSQELYVGNKNSAYTDVTANSLNFQAYITSLQRDAANFRERLICNYHPASGQASWAGYAITNQTCEGSTYNIYSVGNIPKFQEAWMKNETGATVEGSGTETDPYIIHFWLEYILGLEDENRLNRFTSQIADDRTALQAKAANIFNWQVCDKGSSGNWSDKTKKYNANLGIGNRQLMHVNSSGLSFNRKLLSINDNNIILCDNDTTYKVHRLSDMDLIDGWTNETDLAFKTGTFTVSALQQFFTTYTVTLVGMTTNLGKANKFPIWLTDKAVSSVYLNPGDPNMVFVKFATSIQPNTVSGTVTRYPESQRPYFGFMNQISDWRKLSNGDCSSQIDIQDIKKYQKEGMDEVFTNHDGTELMIGAGLPVIKLEKNKKYTFSLKIDTGEAPNETGDYYIWFKDGSFTDGKKPQNESNLYEVTGITKDATGYIMPKDTQKKITISPTRDGYLFCKWRCQALNGGGILYIDKEVSCTEE